MKKMAMLVVKVFLAALFLSVIFIGATVLTYSFVNAIGPISGVVEMQDNSVNYIDSLKGINKIMTIAEIAGQDSELCLRNDLVTKGHLKSIIEGSENGKLERIHGLFELVYTDPDNNVEMYFDKDFNAYSADNNFWTEYARMDRQNDKIFKTFVPNRTQIGVQIVEINDITTKAIVVKSQDNVYVKNGDILVIDNCALTKYKDSVRNGAILGIKFTGGVSYISHYAISDTYYFEVTDIEEIEPAF